MDPLTAGIISGGAGLVGTYLSNQESGRQADYNRTFQMNMSNTAHQREVDDLRKAGLNPILSALGSGSSTPGGATASISDMGPGISKGMDTAIAMRAQNKELQAKDAGIENLGADTRNKESQASLIQNQASSTALDVKQKLMSNKLLQETLPSMIKEAKVKGDWAQVNQIMSIINSGVSSAGSLLNIKNLFKGTPTEAPPTFTPDVFGRKK